MAVYSMTGYGSALGAALDREPNPTSVLDLAQSNAELGAPQGGAVNVEIRSVNSRFLDLTLKLPDELRQHESVLREHISRRVRRGKLEVRVTSGNDSERARETTVPTAEQLQVLARQESQIRMWLPDATPLRVIDVLRMGGGRVAAAVDRGAELMEATDLALEMLNETRAREGQRLVQMLRDRVVGLRSLAERAQPLVPQLVAKQRERFLERWRDAMGAAGAGGAEPPVAAQDRALAEATAFAIRIDVAEELNRLGSHLEEVETLLQGGGEIGKRLDFLMQELHREVNTFGSKSAALELTRIGVDMKVLVEQMREQVQNIE